MERIGDAADQIYLNEAVAVGYGAAGETWSADEVDIAARQRSWFVRSRWPRGPRIEAAAGPVVAEGLAIAAPQTALIDAGSLSLEDELEQSIASRRAGNGLRLVEDERPSVSVVIPTMNEAANLPHVLAEISSDYELIVVDGGSHDGTMEVARTLRPDAIVMQQPGRGKADALFAGFAVATGDVIVTLDADGSQKACEIGSFVDALWAGADFAKGSRIVAGGGSADLTRLRRLGNFVLGKVANTVHGTAYTDLTYGFNAFWRHCLPVVVNPRTVSRARRSCASERRAPACGSRRSPATRSDACSARATSGRFAMAGGSCG